MKNASKKVIISALVLVVAIAMALTSTYAWFTLNTTPEVGGVDLSATTNDGLYISLTGKPGTFRSKLNTGDILVGLLTKANVTEPFADDNEIIFDETVALMNATPDYNFDSITNADVAAKQFTDLTTATTKPTTKALLLKALQDVFTSVYNKLDSVTYVNDKFEKVTGAGTDGAPTYEAVTATSMFSLDLFFMSTNKFDVYVSEATTKAVGTAPTSAYAWKDIAEDAYGTHAAIAKGAALATRAAYAARFKVGTAIINPDQEANGYSTGNLALDYYNAMSNSTELVEPTGLADYLAGDAKTAVGLNGATASTDLYATGIQVATGGTATIGGTGTFISGTTATTINIWLEGWDGDCFNAILNDSFNFTLKFAGNRIIA